MKTTRISRAEALRQREEASKERMALHIALNAVLNHQTSPAFRQGAHTLRLVGWHSAHGGIVLHTYRPTDHKQDAYTCAYYWEDWFSTINNYVTSAKENVDLRSAVGHANSWLFAQRTAQAPVSA